MSEFFSIIGGTLLFSIIFIPLLSCGDKEVSKALWFIVISILFLLLIFWPLLMWLINSSWQFPWDKFYL